MVFGRATVYRFIILLPVSLALASCSAAGLGDITRVFFPDLSNTGSALEFTPSSYDFGLVAAGTGSDTKVFTLNNNSGQAVYIASLNASGTDFSLVSDNCPRTPTALADSNACQATITFAPATAGTKSMSLVAQYGTAVADNSLAASLGLSGIGVSSLSFAGIDSITSITASTLSINWTHVSGAVRYFVYTVSGGTLTYVTDVTAPTATVGLTGLTPAATYTFRVRALDALGVWDGNTNDVSATMLNPGTFTAISNLSAAEGGTSYTANLSCTDMYGSTPVYSVFSQTDTDSTCSISAAPARVMCTPAYKTGHSVWTSTVVTRCVLNGQTYSNSFDVNVSDTNRAPDLAAVSNQQIPVTTAMTAVNVADINTSADTDIDTDALLYSCTFTKDGGAVTTCSSAALTGTYSLNTSTGVVNWTPGVGAITGETNSIYAFTITGSDQRPTALTDTATFSVTVTPINPVMTSVTNRTFALGTQLTVGDTLSLDFNNTRDSAPGVDTNMSYTCYFDKVVDGAVAATTACSTLSRMSFNTATGAMTWVTDFDAFGPFEFIVTGTDSGTTLSGTRIFVMDVRPGYSTSGLVNDYDAQFADLTSLPSVASYAFWKDLTATYDGGVSLFSSGGGWAGTGTAANPHTLYFDGTGNLNLSQILNGRSQFSFNAWIKPSSPTTASTVILGNNGGVGSGLVVRQASDASGKVDMIIGTEYTTYQSLVLKESPIAYWRLGETVGVTASDISGANFCSGSPCNGTYTGGYTLGTAGALSGDANTQTTFNGSTGYVALPQTFSFAGDFTLEAWATNNSGLPGGVIFGTGTTNDDALGNNSAANPYTLFACGTPGSAGTCTTVLSSAVSPGSSTKRHVVLRRSGTTVTLFVDGNQDSVGTSSDVIQISRIGTGTRQASPGLLRYYPGDIDEAAFYSTALSATVIRAHYEAGLSAKFNCRSSTALSSSEWTLLSGIFNYSTKVGSLYFNGKQACNYTTPATYDDTANLFVGSSTTSSNYWTGRLADLKFSSSIATTAVADIFAQTANRFRTQPTPLLYESDILYRIDAANAKDRVNPQTSGGCGNSQWSDNSTFHATSALTNFNCNASSGWTGTGSTADPYRLTFDGTDDYVESGKYASDWSIQTAASAKAVEMWAYLTGTAGLRPLFNIGRRSAYTFFQLSVDSATDRWFMYPNDAVQEFYYDAHNKWTHFIMTTDGSSAQVYINGALILSNNAGGATSVVTPFSFTVGKNDNANPADGDTYFQGDIAYTAVYRRHLTQTDASYLCNALKGRFAGVGAGVTCN